MMNRKNRQGQGLVEYGLILVLVCLMGLMATDKVAKETGRLYGHVEAKVQSIGS
jgi:Flp pilus assembly pilin Flp